MTALFTRIALLAPQLSQYTNHLYTSSIQQFLHRSQIKAKVTGSLINYIIKSFLISIFNYHNVITMKKSKWYMSRTRNGEIRKTDVN